jgi:hypothetical protein
MSKDRFFKIRLTESEYEKFQNICNLKGKNMSEVVRFFINSYVDKYPENVILLSVDDNTLTQASNICKNKHINFNNLIKELINETNNGSR